MRKILLYAVLLFTATASFAQQTEPAPQLSPTKNYLKKSKTQKTFAWVLLGSGIVALGYSAVHVAVATTDAYYFVAVTSLATGQPPPGKQSLGVPIAIGVASVIGSIPLFSAAARNKKKARNASAYLKMEHFPYLCQTSVTNNAYPSVAVRIKL